MYSDHENRSPLGLIMGGVFCILIVFGYFSGGLFLNKTVKRNESIDIWKTSISPVSCLEIPASKKEEFLKKAKLSINYVSENILTCEVRKGEKQINVIAIYNSSGEVIKTKELKD